MIRISRLFTVTALAALALSSFAAAAATVRVTCEVSPGRSKISVDGRRVGAGTFSTQALSGPNLASAPPEAAVAGEIQTDYDSNPRDIARGAVAVSPDFIVGGLVTGKLIDASGNTVISDTVNCRVRNR